MDKQIQIKDAVLVCKDLYKQKDFLENSLQSRVADYCEYNYLMINESNFKDDVREFLEQNRNGIQDLFQEQQQFHKQTINIWGKFHEWVEMKKSYLDSQFMELQFDEIFDNIKSLMDFASSPAFEESFKVCEVWYKIENSSFINTNNEEEYYNLTFEQLSSNNKDIVLKDLNQFTDQLQFLNLIRNYEMEPYHWRKIFEIAQRPNIINHSFTLREMIQMNLDQFKDQILVELNVTQQNQNDILFWKIKSKYEKFTLPIIQYKNKIDTYCINPDLFDQMFQEVENDLKTLKNTSLRNSQSANKEQQIEWQNHLQVAFQNLHRWKKAQDVFLKFENCLKFCDFDDDVRKNQITQYQALIQQYKKLMWETQKLPGFLDNSFCEFRNEFYTELIDKENDISNLMNQFLNKEKRVFPRFFFLTMDQHIEFLSQLESGIDYQNYLNCLFPGIYSLNIVKKQKNVVTGIIGRFFNYN